MFAIGAIGVTAKILSNLRSTANVILPIGKLEYPISYQSGRHLLKSLEKPALPLVNVAYHNREEDQTLCLRKKENLLSLLKRAGIKEKDAGKALQSLKHVFNTRDLKAGQSVEVKLKYHDGTVNLQHLKLEPSPEYFLTIAKKDDTYLGKKINIPLKKHLRYLEGDLKDSFKNAAARKGIPSVITRQVSNVLNAHLTLTKSTKKESRFKLVYEVFENPEGKIVKTGDLLYAAYLDNAKIHQAYRYQMSDGTVGYFNVNGQSVIQARFHPPLANHLKITSRFGLRRNPFSQDPTRHFSEDHKGVDFGCSYNTPVLASASGIVLKAFYYAGYGNYILIRHAGGYQTGYGHLQSFAVKPGMVVKQGQVIGRSGSTGRSTAPHLHFEVIKNGVHVNPEREKLLPVMQLTGKEFSRFQYVKSQVDHQIKRGVSSKNQSTYLAFNQDPKPSQIING